MSPHRPGGETIRVSGWIEFHQIRYRPRSLVALSSYNAFELCGAAFFVRTSDTLAIISILSQ